MDKEEDLIEYILLSASLHNLVRWLLIVFVGWGVARGFRGWIGKREWTQTDNRIGLVIFLLFIVQLLVGVISFFLNAFTPTLDLLGLGSSATMPERLLMWLHLTVMMVAMLMAVIGRVVTKRTKDGLKKHKRSAIWLSLALVLMLAATPWPFMAFGYPWFRWFEFSF